MAETFTPVTLQNDTGQKLNAAYFNRLEAGMETFDDRIDGVERGVVTPITVTYAATVTINAALGSLFRITATGNLTLNDPINGVDGQLIAVEIFASGAVRTVSLAGSDAVFIPAGQWWSARLRYNLASDTWILAEDSGVSSSAPSSGGGTAGVVYVSALGATGDNATNETTLLQTIINGNVGKIITFDPQGIYLVQQLLLPSNTHLNLNGATIRRIINTTGNTNGATLRNTNQGPTSTDVNITVRDGTIDYRADSTGRPWSMNGVTGLRVSNLTIRKTSSTFADWMFHFENCINVRVDNCRVFGGVAVGEDGLHIKSTRDMVVTNCIFESGDDAIVLVQQYGQVRPIKFITISNCVIASQNANAFRISVWDNVTDPIDPGPAETQPIEDVTISNIVIRPPTGGAAGGNCVTIGDQTNTGLIRRIKMSNFSVNASTYPGNAVNITNMWDSEFTNWRVYNASDRTVQLSNGHRLTFTDFMCDTHNTNNPLWGIVGGSTNIKMIGCRVRNATLWGWLIDGAGTRDIQFIGCRAENVPQQAWTITAATRVSLIGCEYDNSNPTTGAAQGGYPIACDAVTPPSSLKVIGCNFTSYTGGQVIANPPATLEYIGNTDVQARGNQLANNKLGFFGTTPIAKPAVTGAKGGNAALTSLIAQMVALGLITDTTT